MNFIWESFVMILTGMLFLRLAGRKSIAQMTIATTVVMISIGSIIVQPIVQKSVVKAALAVGIFIFVLIAVEYLQLKFNFFEKIFIGKSVVVIENGLPKVENLKKLRLTVDKLEIYLRQQGIANISDIKTATLEPNGQMGYEYMPESKPLTVGEFKRLMGTLVKQSPNYEFGFNLFDEVKHEENIQENPEILQ